MPAGDITDDMVTRLGIRLEDPKEKNYTPAMKFTALNQGQLYAARVLSKGYIGELEFLDTARTQSDNSLSFASLTAGAETVLGASDDYIISVKDDATGKYMAKTNIEELKSLENTYIAGGATNFVWYVFDEKIWTIGGAGASSIVVAFYKTPATMTTSVDPVLGKGLYDLIVTLAESELWTAKEEVERHIVAWESAMRQIKILNNKYNEPVEVGPGM